MVTAHESKLARKLHHSPNLPDLREGFGVKVSIVDTLCGVTSIAILPLGYLVSLV